MKTIDRIRAILVADYQIDPSHLAPGARLEDLGVDSIGLAELMFTMEDTFGIAIPDEPLALDTLADVVTQIDRLVAAQVGTASAAVLSQRQPAS